MKTGQKSDIKSKTKLVKRSILLTVAAILLILGLVNNGYTDVKNKAIRICYECIGIG